MLMSLTLITTSPPQLGQAKYCDDRVCLSVREHIRETSRPIFAIFTRVSHVRGSVLLWWRCETLCTSGFMDDVIVTHNGPYAGNTGTASHHDGACRRLVLGRGPWLKQQQP